MVQALEATFDGEVFHPDKPLLIKPNTRVRLVIETMPEATSSPVSFLRTARSLNLEGPEDWSTNLDAYLYEEETQNGS